MNTYRNIAGYDNFVKVQDEAGRLAIVAYDNLIVHQLDNDSLYIFNGETGEWELAGGPSAIVKLGTPNGLELTGNVLSLNLVDETNAGAMSSVDFVKLSKIDYVYEVFTLTAQNISEKKITLSRIPFDSEGLSFIPDGGIPQRMGIDFTVVGNDIIWSGMGLDGFLEENEVIRVSY